MAGDTPSGRLPPTLELKWTDYPSLAAALPLPTSGKLEYAMRALRLGQYPRASKAFEALLISNGSSCVILGYSEFLRRIGLNHQRIELIENHLRSLDQVSNSLEDPKSFSTPLQKDAVRHLLSLHNAEAQLLAQGNLSYAWQVAQDARDWLSTNTKADQLDELQIQILLFYYLILQRVTTDSNWANGETCHVFHENAQQTLGTEPGIVADHLLSQNRFREATYLLLNSQAWASDSRRQVELCYKVVATAENLFRSPSAVDKYAAAGFYIRIALVFGDLGSFKVVELLLNAIEAILAVLKPQLSEWLTIELDTELAGVDIAPASIDDVGCVKSDEDSHPSSEHIEGKKYDNQSKTAHYGPRFDLEVQVLQFYNRYKDNTQLSLDGLLKLAELAQDHGDKPRQRLLLMEAVSSARVRHARLANGRTLNELRQARTIMFDFENDLFPHLATFMAHILCTIIVLEYTSTMSWPTWHQYFQDFLVEFPHFDNPTMLANLHSIAVQAAINLNSPVLERSYRRKEKEFHMQHPYITKRAKPGWKDDTPGNWIAWLPLPDSINRKLVFLDQFDGCLQLMLQWSRQDLESGLLSHQEWVKIFDVSSNEDTSYDNMIHKVSVVELRQVLLGHPDSATSRFLIGSEEVWNDWIKVVEPWLLKERVEPSRFSRHDLLGMLLFDRCTACWHACANLAAQLSGYDTVKMAARTESEWRRVAALLDDEVMTPMKRRHVRRTHIHSITMLGIYPQAKDDGLISQDNMSKAYQDATDLIEEYRELKSLPEIYYVLGLVANLQWRRYFLFKDVSIVEVLSYVKEADDVYKEIRIQQSSAVIGNALAHVGHTALSSSKGVTQLLNLDSHVPKATTYCTEQSVDYWRAWQAAIKENEANANDLKVAYQDTIDQLIHWIQLGKGRSLLDILGDDETALEMASTTLGSSQNLATNELQDVPLDGQITAVQINEENSDNVSNEMDEAPLISEHFNKDADSAPQILHQGMDPVRHADIQQMLAEYGPNVVFVEYFHSFWRDAYDIWVMVYRHGSHDLPRHVDMRFKDVEAWHKSTMGSSMPFTDITEAEKALDKIESLLSPIAQLTHSGETLVICPSKILHSIPLHALKLEGKTLIERNPIAYCQSFSILRHCLNMGQIRQSITPKSSLFYPLAEKYRGTESVRRSAEHVKTLSKTLDAELLFGSELPKDKTMDNLSGCNLVYWHGHFHTNQQSAMLSALCLTDARSKDPNKQITAAELLTVRLQKPALAILIACKSGGAEIFANDDLLGFVPALLYAGASSTISTLWPFDDDDGVSFASAFFKALRYRVIAMRADSREYPLPYVDLAAIMQEAILAIMRDDKGNLKAPYHWAAFTLNGSWLYPHALLASLRKSS
ncbi:hypothetical protein MMC25_008058 [Agyrium rufum]|nr:hypothetical protein [Agyrium rufum]